MKVTLDLDALLKTGKITPEEHQRFSHFASENTGSAAINYLIGFGVITVSSATLALIPTAFTSIVLGLVILLSGWLLLRSQKAQQWQILAQSATCHCQRSCGFGYNSLLQPVVYGDGC